MLSEQLLPASLSWISTLSKAEKARLSKESRLIDIGQKQVVAQHGHKLSHLILVVSGNIDAVSSAGSKQPIRVGQYKEGAMIGWLSVIDGKPLEVSLVTASNAKLLLVSAACAMQLLLNSNSLMIKVLEEMASTIRQYSSEKKLLTVSNAQQRVYINLFNIFNNYGDSHPKIPKQEDIAAQANTCRETVSRALQLLIKKGVIAKDGHRILIKDASELKKAAETGKV